MTYAIRVQAPPDRNGNSRFGWIIASHGKNLEGFVMENGAGPHGAASNGIFTIKRRGEQSGRPGRAAHLDTSPYLHDMPIHISVREFNNLKRQAHDAGTLVGL